MKLKDAYKRLAETIFWPFILFVTTSFFYYQMLLLCYKEMGDESETVVTSKMLAQGYKLYSEVFNHHGPLTFFFGSILELIGNFSVPEHRISVMILQIFILLSIYASPIISNKYTKAVCTILVGLVFIFIFPRHYGHTGQYDIWAGEFLAIAFSLYVISSIFDKSKLKSWHIAIGNFFIGSTAFFAVTYWPALFLIFVLSLHREYLFLAIKWLIIAVVLNMIFLSAIGSISGYFIDHFYINFVTMSLYASNTPLDLMMAIGETVVFNKMFLPVFVVLFFSLCRFDQSKFHWKIALLVLAISSFFMRGMSWHAMPALYIIVVSYAFVLAFIINRYGNRELLFLLIVFAISVILTLYGNKYIVKLRNNQFPISSEFSLLVKKFTNKEDRIIVYSFRNVEYLLSDRLPASGAFFYLPWQEKYNEKPKFGIKVDPCQDIKENKPKIMLVDKWNVWDKYPWNSYAGCVQKIIDENYSQIGDRQYYVRNDLASTVLKAWYLDIGH